MKKRKRLLCVLAAAALLLGILAGCGGDAEEENSPSGSSNGSLGSSESGKPGAGATIPGISGHTEDDPVAVMNEKVRAVNDAVNFEFLGLEKAVEAGLLFYRLNAASPSGETYDYDPDNPQDYDVNYYSMARGYADYIVDEDTHDVLVADVQDRLDWVSSQSGIASFESKEVEADDLYAFCYYAEGEDGLLSESGCAIYFKGTDIGYSFRVYERGAADLHIFTNEFWEDFAQTVKFVASERDDTKYDGRNLIDEAFNSRDYRDYRRKEAYNSVLYNDVCYADLTDLDQDGVDELLVLEYDTFSVYSWKEGERQRRRYEEDIAFAKLIDMDQDGREELILISDYGDVAVYSWGDSGIQKTRLDIDISIDLGWGGYDGVYRDKTTGEIYFGSTRRGHYEENCHFASVTDSVKFYKTWTKVIEPDDVSETTYHIRVNGDSERQVDEDEYESQLGRFELIEQIDLYSSDWKDALRHTVEEVRQRLCQLTNLRAK